MSADLDVFTYCAYLCGEGWQGSPSQDFYNATKFAKALKRQSVNGWAAVPVPIGGATRTLRDHNRRDAFAWFAEMVHATLPNHFAGPTRLVPVPGSKVTSFNDVMRSSTFEMASAIAARLKNATVEPLLWWSEAIPSAHHEGGPRDPALLYPKLVLSPLAASQPNCILIDDVKTSGGHLQACEAKLRSAGVPVMYAICAGRTVYDEALPAFGLYPEKLARFTP